VQRLAGWQHKRGMTGDSRSDRELLLLVAWEGLTPAEAAAVLGISQVAARTRLHRARKRAMKALQQFRAALGTPHTPELVTTLNPQEEAS
jgi:DNA-directed RNA polymerase specialized sigma24 family protein